MNKTYEVKIDELFTVKIRKVVPNSDPSVIVFDIYEDGTFNDTLTLWPDQALQLSKVLIEAVIEPED